MTKFYKAPRRVLDFELAYMHKDGQLYVAIYNDPESAWDKSLWSAEADSLFIKALIEIDYKEENHPYESVH